MAISAVAAAVSSVAADVIATELALGTFGTAVVRAVVGVAVSSVVSSAFAGGGSKPSTTVEQGLLINSASNIAPLPVIYGSRRVGGVIVFSGTSGASNEYLHVVIALCEGEISAINTVYIDDVDSADEKFSGLVTVEKFLGTDTQAASTQLMEAFPEWTSAHQAKGVAYIHVRLTFNQNVFHGLPVITCDVDGTKVLDVRDGTIKFSANPALCIRDYLSNARYGRGIEESLIDDASIIAAADYCDTLVSIPDGTQPLYECTGVVNVDDTAYVNMQRMLTSCRGMLIFSGGKYRLLIDKAETPAFTFDEDNITGAWEFAPQGKREKFNRISASFFNPERSWQPDIAIQSSAAMLAEDNGLTLERKLDLPFTADLYRAQHIIQQELKQSRSGMTVRFTAFQSGLRCEVGDVVYITHETPGWDRKTFRVMSIDIKDDDEVSIVAREYDAGVYVLDALDAKPIVPATSLPDPFAVAAPGVPDVTETLYATREGSGVKAKATITTAGSADAFVTQYQFEWRQAGSGTWQVLGRSSATTMEVYDVAPGIYDARVKAINTLGVSSAYAMRSNVEVAGLMAAPSNITGLSVQAAGGLAIVTWALHPDLDVRIGGRIRVRHSSALSGATWETSVSIGEAIAGNVTVAVLPLKEGTYLLRAEDSSGILSPTAAMVSTKQASALAWSPLTTVQEDDDFTGTHDHTAVSAGELLLGGVGLIDDVSDMDGLQSIDFMGGVSASGTYDFAAGMDLGSVQRVRLTGLIAAQAVNVIDRIDERSASIDDWVDVDGTLGAPVDAWIEVRETDDDPAGAPTWSEWKRLDAAEFDARAFEFRARLTSDDPSYTIRLNQLRVAAANL